jgi:hypothetical protein
MPNQLWQPPWGPAGSAAMIDPLPADPTLGWSPVAPPPPVWWNGPPPIPGAIRPVEPDPTLTAGGPVVFGLEYEPPTNIIWTKNPNGTWSGRPIYPAPPVRPYPELPPGVANPGKPPTYEKPLPGMPFPQFPPGGSPKNPGLYPDNPTEAGSPLGSLGVAIEVAQGMCVQQLASLYNQAAATANALSSALDRANRMRDDLIDRMGNRNNSDDCYNALGDQLDQLDAYIRSLQRGLNDVNQMRNDLSATTCKNGVPFGPADHLAGTPGALVPGNTRPLDNLTRGAKGATNALDGLQDGINQACSPRRRRGAFAKVIES